MVRLMEESGELARLVNHVYGPKKKKLEEAEQGEDQQQENGHVEVAHLQEYVFRVQGL